MPLSDGLVRLDLRDSDAARSWPEHERRKRLGLRRLHDMLVTHVEKTLPSNEDNPVIVADQDDQSVRRRTNPSTGDDRHGYQR